MIVSLNLNSSNSVWLVHLATSSGMSLRTPTCVEGTTKSYFCGDNGDWKSHTRFTVIFTDQIVRPSLHPNRAQAEEIYGQISEGTIVTAEYRGSSRNLKTEAAAGGWLFKDHDSA